MSIKIVGICGICGGDVTLPSIWHGIYPPKPSCQSCGAIACDPSLPVLPMQPRRERRKPFHAPANEPFEWMRWVQGEPSDITATFGVLA